MKILLAVIIMMVTGLSQVQAGKQKTTESGAIKPSISSTTNIALATSVALNGRPSNLDPRIPWLEDLGMAQSGGSEPLVKVNEITLPSVGSVDTLAEIDGRIVFTDGADLYCCDMNGNVLWGKSMPGPGRWMVLVSSREIYAFPSAIGDKKNAQVNIFSVKGELMRKIDWPIDPGNEWVTCAAFSRGVLVADMSSQHRIHARIDPNSTVVPDDIMTVGDVSINGEGNDEVHKKNYKAGYAVIGARIEDWDYDREGANLLNVRRQIRLGKLRGHKLKISSLPGYAPSAADKEVSRGDWWKPETYVGRVLAIEPDGSIWTTFGIHNPYHFAREKMNVLDDKKQTQRLGKTGIALFAPDGHLRGYMVSDCPKRPAGGVMYLICGNLLVRVEPMKGK